jgi:hypothetical protein
MESSQIALLETARICQSYLVPLILIQRLVNRVNAVLSRHIQDIKKHIWDIRIHIWDHPAKGVPLAQLEQSSVQRSANHGKVEQVARVLGTARHLTPARAREESRLF